MKLYLVRHGETDWNKERRIQGQADIPLNEFGRNLAKKTAFGLKNVPFAACYSSPLERAVETAQLILGGRDVPIFTDKRIEEMAFGEWEGKCCSKKGWELPESFRAFFHDPEHYEPAPSGESFAQVRTRTGDFLLWLAGQKQYQEQNILIATHGAALAGMLNYMKKGRLPNIGGREFIKIVQLQRLWYQGKVFRCCRKIRFIMTMK